MARSINPKCLSCAQLSIDAARALHGENGDGCWNEQLCHRRRSHYAKRDDNNQRRRGQYALAKSKPEDSSPYRSPKIEGTLVIPQTLPVAPAIALLYLYRRPAKDSHLHAIAISIWQGDQKLEQIQPKHCMGMTNRQVRSYLQSILEELTARYGIREFEPEIIRDPALCPILPCPLKDSLRE